VYVPVADKIGPHDACGHHKDIILQSPRGNIVKVHKLPKKLDDEKKIMPRDASLSDGCTPDRCNFFSLTIKISY